MESDTESSHVHALSARDVVVNFGATPILKSASITVAAGEIHALIGPNGAGKTTLANVFTGHVRPAAGVIELHGESLGGPTWRRARKGIGRKFQIPRVFPRLTCEQNLRVAHRGSASFLNLQNFDSVEIRDTPGKALSHGWRQRLELRMVESQQPLVAVLDEPTAGMTKTERVELAELIRSRRGQTTYLIVEHDMDFVQTVADRVSFMHDGQVIATGEFAEIERHPTVRQIYLGVTEATRHADAQ